MERNIKFQYFTLSMEIKLNNTWMGEGKFNLLAWIDHVNKKKLEKTTIELKDTKARIEKIKYFTNQDVWIIRFMKLRDENLPYIAKENQEAEGIPLEPDEYIGEDMYMLYDVNNNVAMIQSNRFSLGLSRLAEFLAKSQGLTDTRIKINALTRNIDLKKFKKNSYRTIEMGFSNLLRSTYSNNSSLGEIMDTYRKFNSVSGSIKISVGRGKDDTLDITEANQLIEEIASCENIISAKVRIRDDDSGRIEVVDLFDNIASDILTFSLRIRESLGFDYASSKMIGTYEKSKKHIVKLLDNNL